MQAHTCTGKHLSSQGCLALYYRASRAAVEQLGMGIWCPQHYDSPFPPSAYPTNAEIKSRVNTTLLDIQKKERSLLCTCTSNKNKIGHAPSCYGAGSLSQQPVRHPLAITPPHTSADMASSLVLVSVHVTTATSAHRTTATYEPMVYICSRNSLAPETGCKLRSPKAGCLKLQFGPTAKPIQ